MDLSIGSLDSIELSSAYNKNASNEPLHFGVSKNQDSFYIRPDMPEVQDNLPKGCSAYKAIETGARNLTDFLAIGVRGIDSNILAMTEMLYFGVNYEQRSLLDIAKLYEEESERVMGLTDITEQERESRIYVLDRAFFDVARQSLSKTDGKDIGKNFGTLTEFTQNAVQNIRVSGLSEKTQGLMVEALEKATFFYKDRILCEARNKMVEQHMRKKGWGLSREELIAIEAENIKRHKQQLDKLKSIMKDPFDWSKWTSAVISNKKGQDEDDLLNIADEENIDEENVGEENAVEETSPENSTEV